MPYDFLLYLLLLSIIGLIGLASKLSANTNEIKVLKLHLSAIRERDTLLLLPVEKQYIEYCRISAYKEELDGLSHKVGLEFNKAYNERKRSFFGRIKNGVFRLQYPSHDVRSWHSAPPYYRVHRTLVEIGTLASYIKKPDGYEEWFWQQHSTVKKIKADVIANGYLFEVRNLV